LTILLFFVPTPLVNAFRAGADSLSSASAPPITAALPQPQPKVIVAAEPSK